MAPSRRSRAPWGALALIALLVAGAHARGLAADDASPALAAVPGDLHHLSTAGRWRSAEGATGFYRVIVLRRGWDHVAELLYVQWMADGDSENSPRPVATTGVGEINDAGPFTLTHTVRAVATNQLRITVTARHVHTGARRQLVVVAGVPGGYKIQVPRAVP